MYYEISSASVFSKSEGLSVLRLEQSQFICNNPKYQFHEHLRDDSLIQQQGYFTARISDAGVLADLMDMENMGLIVSQKLAQILVREVGEDISLIPFIIQDQITPPLYFLYVHPQVACLDRPNSQPIYATEIGRYRFKRKVLFLRNIEQSGKKIFYINNAISKPIISQELCDVLAREAITGIALTPYRVSAEYGRFPARIAMDTSTMPQQLYSPTDTQNAILLHPSQEKAASYESQYDKDIVAVVDFICAGKLPEAIEQAQTYIRSLSSPILNRVIGMNLLEQTEQMVEYIDSFIRLVEQTEPVVALYSELDEVWGTGMSWKGDLLSYNEDYGSVEPIQWMPDMIRFRASSIGISIEIPSFAQYSGIIAEYEQEEMDDGTERCGLNMLYTLVCLRYQELFQQAFDRARERGVHWSKVLLYVGYHDRWDLMYRVI